MFPKKKTKSPVIPIPRRAGQSLADRWQVLVDDQLVPIVFVPAMIWAVALGAWTQSTRSMSLRFWLGTAVVATGIAAVFYRRLLPQARALVRGERGERAVAGELEELRSIGFRCFHDIIGDGFNIDHVVVGPPGVFVVETKYRSGSGVIEFRNGKGIFVAGREEERDPLKQARGNAREIRKLIQRDTGLERYVKALVVFVGDWRVKDDWQNTDVRVITADGIGRYFARQDQPELTRREIELICSHLKRTTTVV